VKLAAGGMQISDPWGCPLNPHPLKPPCMRGVRPPPFNAFVLHRLIKRFSCGQLERCVGMVKSGLASCLFTNPYCTVIVYNYVYIVGTEWCLLILNILIVYGVIN